MLIDKLRQAKKASFLVQARVQGVRDALANVLADDSELGQLYLSEVFADPTAFDRERPECEEVECILESYLAEVDSVISHIKFLTQEIESTEDIMELRLAESRNRLIKADLVISVVTMCFGFGGVVVGGYGMSEAEKAGDEAPWFQRIFYGTFVCMVVMTLTILAMFAKLRLFR